MFPDQTIDYSRKWYVMAAVAVGIFLSTIDGSIVNVALPTMVRELGTDFATVQWVVLAYLLTLATLMLTVGRLADMRGKKSIYLAGFIIFTAGSVLCGLAPAIQWLIAFRVVQAVGAAMILALGLAIVTEAFPPHERGRALGVAGGLVSVGIIVGPTLGGLIVSAANWRWVFFVNLPVGITGILMVARYVPAFRPSGRQKFDLGGAVTLFISLLCLLTALSIGQSIGYGDRRILALGAGFFIFLALFVWIERRVEQPMIELSLFGNSLFSINLITGFITFVAIAGTIILMPFYLEGVLGYSPREVGLLMAIVPVVLAVVAPLSGALSDRVGTRPITALGLLILMFGYYLLSMLDSETTAWEYVLRFLPIGIGMGIFQSPNNSAIMGAAPRERLGIASGILALNRSLGQTVGIAVVGAIWASRVVFYYGRVPAGGASEAPTDVQVLSLNDTFLILTALLGVALALGIWAVLQERRSSSVGAL